MERSLRTIRFCPQCGNILNTAPQLLDDTAAGRMKCVNCRSFWVIDPDIIPPNQTDVVGDNYIYLVGWLSNSAA